MKITVIVLVSFLFGCSSEVSQQVSATTGFSVEGVVTEAKNFVNEILQKFSDLFNKGTSQLPYCDAVVEHSPTIDDYQANWFNDPYEVLCPEWGAQKIACLQKRKEAFFSGLLCYRE